VAVDLVDLLAAGQAQRVHELVEQLGLAPAVEQAGVDEPALDRGEAVGAEELVVGLLVVVHPQVEELAQGGDVLALLAHVDEPAHEGLHGVHVRVGELRLEGHRGPVHLHPGVEALEEWLGGLPRGADGRGGEETTEGDLVGVDEAGERLVHSRGVAPAGLGEVHGRILVRGSPRPEEALELQRVQTPQLGDVAGRGGYALGTHPGALAAQHVFSPLAQELPQELHPLVAHVDLGRRGAHHAERRPGDVEERVFAGE
jgi:hypothetical protein